MKGNLEDTGVDDGGLLAITDGTAAGASSLKSLDDIEGLFVSDLAKDDVTVIKPRGLNGGDEELGTVGVGAGVGHGKKTGAVVLLLEVLVGELLAVDGLATSAVATGEVTTLEHEIGDDTVEGRALVAEAVLASAELLEVAGGLGDDVVVELEVNAASLGLNFGGRLAVDKDGALPLDIEENLGHDVGCLRKCSGTGESCSGLER
jgi:hypothetical protein